MNMDYSVVTSHALPAVTGHARHAVLAAARAAAMQGDAATLAVVLETDGSTYVAPGAIALFGAAVGQVGWLSGGCLEPEIERIAIESARMSRIAWMEVDTRDDEDLLSGSALGCRGRLRIALLPLRAMPGIAAPLAAWLAGRTSLRIEVHADGAVSLMTDAIDAVVCGWRIATAAPAWASATPMWALRVDARPELLVFGAGPETPTLLPLLRAMGWMTTLAERRERWRAQPMLADRHLALSPADALRASQPLDAALVMHHNFELDREALAALADDDTRFIGLLGPVRRREDLFRVLPAAHRAAL
ncbi:MAG: XdhC family protein, partial [Luteimonas sp.]